MARSKRYFAALNTMGFTNSWSVYAFDGKGARDAFVEANDGYNRQAQREQDCRPCSVREVPHYATNVSLSDGRAVKPTPFTSECWMIGPAYGIDSATEGLKGEVQVMDASYHHYERLHHASA